MNPNRTETHPLSPRLAGAIFFAIFSLLFMLFAKYTLLSLQNSALLPLLPAIFASLITGAFVGYAFGKFLAKKSHWSRPVLIGVLIALLSLFLASLAILTYYYLNGSVLIVGKTNQFQDYAVLFGAIFLSLILTIGLWLVPLAGLAAVYFNKHFLPGLIAVDQQRLNDKEQGKKEIKHDE